MESTHIATADGWQLHLRHRPAVGEARGAALCLPAMMVDSRTLFRRDARGLAATLAAAGWSVYAGDFRGHGKSGPTAKQGADWRYRDLVHHDVPALIDAVRAREPGKPLFVVGHSLGTHTTAASWASGRCKPDGLVMLAGSPWLNGIDSRRRRPVMRAAVMGLLAGIAKTVGRFPARRLRIGSADEAGGYVRDLARWTQWGEWGDGERWLDQLGAIDGPVLSVTSEGDTFFSPTETVQPWASHMPTCEHWVCRAGTHGLDYTPGHMALGADPRSRPLWEAVAQWMADHAG